MCFQVRLNPAESSDVLKRWAEHLCSSQVNQKSKAILVLLSLGCFYKVGEMLHRWEPGLRLFEPGEEIPTFPQKHFVVFTLGCIEGHGTVWPGIFDLSINLLLVFLFSSLTPCILRCLSLQKALKESYWGITATGLMYASGSLAGMLLGSDNISPLLPLPVSFFFFHLLGSMRHFDRAALFIEACLKYGVMEANDSSNILFEIPFLSSEGRLEPELAAELTLPALLQTCTQ